MENLINLLDTIPFWYWWVLAVGLLTIELMTGSTYFLWPAIAAVLVGILAVFSFSTWQAELLLFAIATTGLSLVAPKYVKPWIHKTQADHLTLNERGAQKIGRRAVVDQAFANGSGKVRLGDTLWLAESESGQAFVAGEEVVVASVDGTKLIVKGAS